MGARQNLRHSFERQVFRTRPYEYDGVDQLGHMTIVLEADKGFVSYLTHDLYRVEPGQMNYDDFCQRHIVDIYLNGTEAAELYRDKVMSRLVIVPPAKEIIEDLLSVKPPKEDTVLSFRDKQNITGKTMANCSVLADELNRPTLAIEPTNGKTVRHIPLDGGTIELVTTPSSEFLTRYQPYKKYPPNKLAAILVEYAIHLGGSTEALAELGRLVYVKAEETEMAVTKKTAAKDAPAKEAKTKVAKAEKPAAEPKEKKASASGLFQSLILEGKLTDAQIFEKVAKEFDLDDSKKSYVGWYRNKLKKDGKNPPAPIGGEKPAKEEKAPKAKK